MLLANRYRVVRQLGQGGMGSVWLAEDTQLDNKPFAIKMLPSILVSNKRAYRQLKDEALVAMQLVHPNIVQIRAFEENNGNPFLVMDYIDGETLDDYLAEHTGTTGVPPVVSGNTGPTGILPVASGLPESEVIRLLRPIAAALDYAHLKGVVHRDVKPGNVMVAKDGTPYILDFGIAREIQETMTRVTGKLSSGTLLYMSPEQLNGDAPKPAQDIYSFAAMAYECLKGEPPFSRGNIEFQIMNKQPEPLYGDTPSAAGAATPPNLGGEFGDTPSAAGAATPPRLGGEFGDTPSKPSPNSSPETGEVAAGRRGMTIASSVMSGLAKKPEDRPKTCAAVLEGGGFSRVSTYAEAPSFAKAPEGETVDKEHVGGNISSHKEHKEYKEVGRGVPRDRDGRVKPSSPPRRNGAGIVLPAICIVAALLVLGGVLWHREQQRKRTEWRRIVAAQRAEEAARQREEEERRAKEEEEAARRKAESERRAAEESARKKALNEQSARKKEEETRREQEKAERKARESKEAAERAAAKEARIDAMVYKSKIEQISGDDGFKARKDELAEIFVRADALFDEKVRGWGESARHFKDYVSRCNNLVKLDGERRLALRNRKQAQDAFKSAEVGGAKIYARDSWNAAVAEWKSATDAFGRMEFATAAKVFEVSSHGFVKSAAEAQNNKRLAALKHTYMRERGAQQDEVSRPSNSSAKEEDFLKQIRMIVSTSPLVHDSGTTLFLPSHPKFNSKWANFCEEVRAFRDNPRREDAYALIDTTVFGAGDEGILIDKIGITVRSMMMTGAGDGFISWDDFARKGAVETSFGRVTLCEAPLIRLNGVDFSCADKIATLMNKLLDVARNTRRRRDG